MSKFTNGEYAFIELDGLDRTGKKTQTALLAQVMQPCTKVTFPNYGVAWSAEFVKATLQEQPITVRRGYEKDGIKPLTLMPKKHPYVFQMWQSADRLEAEPALRRALGKGHVLADRYKLAAEAYGKVDGCEPRWLAEMRKLYLPVDLTFIFVGGPFSRPGERPDLNERDTLFLRKVRCAYEELAQIYELDHVLIDVDDYKNASVDSAPLSMLAIHKRLVTAINIRLGLEIAPMKLANWQGDY